MTEATADPSRHADGRFIAWSRRIRTSDAVAFRELFEAMHAELLRFAWRYTLDDEVARDLVQDAFLKLWQVRETLDEERSVRALLYVMVRNLALNYRRTRIEVEMPAELDGRWDPASHEGLEALSETRMLERQLACWIDRLPERRREAFVLSRYHGLTHEEIALLMGLTPRTVNTHIVLALKDLRHRLEALELHDRS